MGQKMLNDSRHSIEDDERDGNDLAQLAFCVLDISTLSVNTIPEVTHSKQPV